MIVRIHGRHIVWVNRPFRPEKINKVQMFRQYLQNELEESKNVCAGDGYVDR